MAGAAQQTYVALLRGINVGGNAKVPMVELKAMFEALGYTGVKTYINSGNVVFRTRAANSRSLEPTIEAGLAEQFGFPISVVVRSLAEMDTLVEALPESWQPPDNLRCYVLYLKEHIDNDEELAALAPRPDIEEVTRVPGALLWGTQLDAVTRSNLQKINGTPAYRALTIRNLNTTLIVHHLMKAAEAAVLER